MAAPLLAGASLALLGVVIVEGEQHFRWPEVTLLIVVAASIALIASIQIGANARKYLYNRETIDAWYGDLAKRSRAWSEHSEHFGKWKTHIRRAVIAFNAGTTLLILAVSTALLPRDNDAIVRWISVGLAVAGAIVESWWIFHLSRETFEAPVEKPKSLDGGTH
ncbi:hypothetical protein [Streptomyces lincolnensis]|uniref:hypothetical protein n=1 Tax=Streptomyces lincolnensis TaxID=1915 RepID=UPI0037D70062